MIKPHNNLLLIISSVILMTSCQSIYQVLEISSTDPKISSSNNEYETNELKVSYNFWSNGGKVYFQFTNKLDVPIYIDWNKSHLINNGISYDYWNDTEETKRIIQVPPNSSIIISKFTINKSPFYDCNFNLKTSRKKPINTKTFNVEETPLKFRHFITCSTKEDFTSPIIVDNSFYLSSVSFMPLRTFLGKSLSRKDCDLKGVKTLIIYKERPFKKPNNFYIKFK
jgi:hypothetical protein